MGADAGKKWHAEKEYVWHGTQQAVASVIGNSMSKAGVCNLGSARRIVSPGKAPSFRNDTWRRLGAQGTDRSAGRTEEQNCRGLPNGNKIHQLRSTESIKR